jgi:hypothetical protein
MYTHDIPPGPGQLFQLRCVWTGRPRTKHLPEYRRWVLCTTQSLADRWRSRILYGLGVTPNCTEFWAFEPGAAPKLVEKLDCRIP